MSRHYHRVNCRCGAGASIEQVECTLDKCGTPQVDALGYLNDLDLDNPKLMDGEQIISCSQCTFTYLVFWNNREE